MVKSQFSMRWENKCWSKLLLKFWPEGFGRCFFLQCHPVNSSLAFKNVHIEHAKKIAFCLYFLLVSVWMRMQQQQQQQQLLYGGHRLHVHRICTAYNKSIYFHFVSFYFYLRHIYVFMSVCHWIERTVLFSCSKMCV